MIAWSDFRKKWFSFKDQKKITNKNQAKNTFSSENTMDSSEMRKN